MKPNNNIQEVSTNVINAFEVVRETHIQVEKLLKALDETAEKNKLKCLTKDKFLSWQVIHNTWGWLLSSFIKVYEDEKKYPNSVFTIEVHFENSAKIVFGIHLYKNGFRQEKYTNRNYNLGWIYSHRRTDVVHKFSRKSYEDIFISKPMNAKDVDVVHEDFILFAFKEIPLLELNKANLNSKIFSEVKNLYDYALFHADN
jgi:hypothetical protein